MVITIIISFAPKPKPTKTNHQRDICYNKRMNVKDKIDLLVKRAELIYKKLFILAVFAIILNLLKFGEIQKELKEFSDD